MNDPDATLRGATIRRLRKTQGMNLVTLAEKAELSLSFISQVERGLTRRDHQASNWTAQPNLIGDGKCQSRVRGRGGTLRGLSVPVRFRPGLAISS